ncbi:TIGR03790 family protein [Synoicihabitans lomoniglobus]|uniref:TIGR03790 family protein n=1 Tax=Synoicihabitans lomoniglobus TaxID=2909285 RepID=A0AAF0CPT4_9BACT|nr:TIGR03790 family protein [Opitutaceae bacterium LMO-M01]WED65825.1 TIGR03790 family protein [Opitutaceae bacterium LMO-M01]
MNFSRTGLLLWKSFIGAWLGLLGGASAMLGAPGQFPRVADEASRVVIVANLNDPDSVELARFYSDRRNIPRANIVALDLPAGEEISWGEFVARLHEPLRGWLRAHDWLQAIEMEASDDAGRRKMSVSGHRISYLVTCRGVPLKIRHDKELPSDSPATERDSFKTNRAAVDAELALLAQSHTRRDGVVANPVFHKAKPDMFQAGSMIRVARLDGPTFPAARNLVESAIEAERQGLIGRAMVDIGGPHKTGDKWFEAAADQLTAAGWDPLVDRERKTVESTGRADMLAIYLGWYSSKLNGPFSLPGYQFAPGAIALHLHSFSASSLRLMNGGGWCGPLIGRGVAATFGNVYEPYLEFTHQPQLLMEALLSGSTLGEAAYYAMPVLSWQSVVIGDPLYRPLTIDLAAQSMERDRLPGRLASYVALRQLAKRGEVDAESVLPEAAAAMRAHPSLALALALSRLREATGDRAGAVRELGLASYLRTVRADEWGLMAEIAEQLMAWEENAAAVKVWRALLKQDLPPGPRMVWLKVAQPLARAAGEFELSTVWDQEIMRLTPPK